MSTQVELETYTSNGPSRASVHESALDEQQELPPVDGGRAAWLFLVSGFVMECTTWGFSSSFGVIEVSELAAAW